MLASLREEVWRLHGELPRNGLVTWTSGNVSARDPSTGLVVIKPSGVRYDELTPEHMVVMNLEGETVEGDFLPSVDSASHLYIYRVRPDVGGIVHTHSPYATAFAAVGHEIPCVLTAIADEFGGPIPCGGYASIGGEEIGTEVERSIGESPATAVAAVKAAVMTEDAARTVFLARQLGEPQEIPPAEIERAHKRYLEQYGQVKK